MPNAGLPMDAFAKAPSTVSSPLNWQLASRVPFERLSRQALPPRALENGSERMTIVKSDTLPVN